MSRYYRFRFDYTQEEEPQMSQFGPLPNPDPTRQQDGGVIFGVHDFGRPISASLVVRMLRNRYGGRRQIFVVPLSREEYLRVRENFDDLTHQ